MDKDWETVGGLFVISGDWVWDNFDQEAFPTTTKFAQSKYLCLYSTLLHFASHP